MNSAPTQLALQQALERIAAALQSGNLDEAERACRLILAGDPGQVDALNLLGVGPSDLVAILEALKQAGALKAEMVVI